MRETPSLVVLHNLSYIPSDKHICARNWGKCWRSSNKQNRQKNLWPHYILLFVGQKSYYRQRNRQNIIVTWKVISTIRKNRDKEKGISVRGHNRIQGVQGGPQRLTFDPNNIKTLLTLTWVILSNLHFKNLSFCICKMQLFTPSTSGLLPRANKIMDIKSALKVIKSSQ